MGHPVAEARARAAAESRLKARSTKPLTKPMGLKAKDKIGTMSDVNTQTSSGLKSRLPKINKPARFKKVQEQPDTLKHVKRIISELPNQEENEVSFKAIPGNLGHILSNGRNPHSLLMSSQVTKRSTYSGMQVATMPESYFKKFDTVNNNRQSFAYGKSPAATRRMSLLFPPLTDSTFLNFATPATLKKNTKLAPIDDAEDENKIPSTSCDGTSNQVKRALFTPKKMVHFANDPAQKPLNLDKVNCTHRNTEVEPNRNADAAISLSILPSLIDNLTINEWHDALKKLNANQKTKFNKIVRQCIHLQTFNTSSCSQSIHETFELLPLEEISDQSVVNNDTINCQDAKQKKKKRKTAVKKSSSKRKLRSQS